MVCLILLYPFGKKKHLKDKEHFKLCEFNFNSTLTRLGGEWQGQIGVCEERLLLVVLKQLSKGPDAEPDMERERREEALKCQMY